MTIQETERWVIEAAIRYREAVYGNVLRSEEVLARTELMLAVAALLEAEHYDEPDG